MKGKIGLLLIAAAAIGYYRYSQMSKEEKDRLKKKGQDFIDKNFGEIGNLFSKKESPVNGNA